MLKDYAWNMENQKECLECERLTNNMHTALRMDVHVTGGNDFKKAEAENQAHREAAHPESIADILAG